MKIIAWLNGVITSIEVVISIHFFRSIWTHDQREIFGSLILMFFMGLFWVATLIELIKEN